MPRRYRQRGLKGQEDDFWDDELAPPPLEKCQVQAGFHVGRWDGRLTPSQCKRFSPGKKLGRGTFATAYTDAKDPNRVVKFTADMEDAISSAIVANEKPMHAVQIYDVVELKGQKASAPVRDRSSSKHSNFSRKNDQPVFAISSQRLDPLSDDQQAAVIAFGLKFAEGDVSPLDIASRTDPKKFRFDDLLDRKEIRKECVVRGGSPDGCHEYVSEIAHAMDEMAFIGIVPLDLHLGNWGSYNGHLQILDFGVSAGLKAPPRIPKLAGATQKQSPRTKLLAGATRKKK